MQKNAFLDTICLAKLLVFQSALLDTIKTSAKKPVIFVMPLVSCEESIYYCTSYFTPYVLNDFKCRSPLRQPPPTATLRSSSDPQTFILMFSNQMTITPDILTQNLEFSLTNAEPSDYYLLQITAQPDTKTFRLTFNFTKDMGIETLTATLPTERQSSTKMDYH